MNEVYITSTGAFLPGPPIDNDEIENVLGLVNGKKSKLKRRILKSNGIKTRHYAIDAEQQTRAKMKTWRWRPHNNASIARSSIATKWACFLWARRKGT